jgi:hypothetical protein
LSKPVASRGWVCVFCIVPVLAILAAALFVVSPARHGNSAGSASAASLTPKPGAATPAARARIQASYAALPLAFEQNQGQTDSQVKYMARANGYTLFLTANDAVFSLRSRASQAESSSVRSASALRAKNPRGQNSEKASTAVVRMQLVGGNSLAKVASGDQLPGKTNYFIGNDPSKWRSNVTRYARVSYADVYPGVNLAFHGAQRQLEFDFVVAPGANPAPIGFHFTGAQRMNTDDSGNLILSSAAGDVLLHKPVAYQEENGARQNVDARFVLKANNQVSFQLGNYDRSRELVIDPAVSYAYSTYLGGSGAEQAYGIAFDSSGDAYVTGQTASQNFPGTSGGFTGTAQVFVTKISSAGSSLVYSTYIGGTGANGDSGNAIAVNSSGDAFVAGNTTSTDFPTTAGVFQTVLHGTAGNAFVLKLDSSGAITYSTYLGGTGDDTALGVALASDGSGDVYVAGKASSTNFPTTSNPLQGYLSGSTGSGFVTKLNASGTAPLLFSTYLGGSSVGDGDLASAVAVDSSNNVYVTGQTFSSTFHTTTGAFQTGCGSCTNGNSNAFVTVINPAGSSYIYSTFLGGNALDVADGIAVDSANSAYVTGATESSNFPTTSGAWQTTYGTNTDAFVTKLNPAGSALVYSTYLGGSGFDTGISVAVDGTNNAYVTGQTSSSNFPIAGPTESAFNGGNSTTSPDAFVSELNPAGSQLVFSTYLGGSADEDDGLSGGIAVDSAGDTIYVTGETGSTNFPTTSPFQATNGGSTDAFVVKYTQGPSFTIAASTPAAVAPGSSGSSTVTLTAEHGYSSAVNLSCSVSGSGSPAPACSASSFSPDSATPTTAGATSALTITTTGPSGAMVAPRKFFYAMWLPIVGLSLMGMSFSSTRSRRKKLLGFLMIGMVMAALFVMPACGGSSNNGGGGGGGGGTPAGSYTVTITGTGTDANAITETAQVTLTVN